MRDVFSIKYTQAGRLFFISAIFSLASSCHFSVEPKAPRRLPANFSLVVGETVVIERSGDRSSMSVLFETREAANCKIGFYPTSKTPPSVESYLPCSGKSAMKFSEVVPGIPKDQLVVLVIMSWASKSAESTARQTVITEESPTADSSTINLLLVDLGGGRLEFSAVNKPETPSALINTTISGDIGCWLSDSKSTGFTATRKELLLQGATSRGFINTSTARISPNSISGSFQAVQRQSTEWGITARTNKGFGQLRVAKPLMLKSATFAGRDQASGLDDTLDDIDPSALKLTASQTFVSSWTLDGANTASLVTLAIAPSGTFQGITCVAPASAGKITVPSTLVAKIPSGERVWATLRLDSWQAMDTERWLVRVSDWKSIGIQRL